MSNDGVDPSGNTQQFKAFVQAPSEDARPSRAPLVVGVVVALVLVVLVAYLALS
jgi:hypothetical protein